MDEDEFDYNDTAIAPIAEQEFLLENLCGTKGQQEGGYEPPATRSASKRWKRFHEQSMMLRLDEMHIIKKQNAQMSKEAARKIIRKIPVEILAKEWLSKEDATVDMRAYLVDHVLPTLILGVERLLKEVDEKGLSATNRFEPEFNPINFLAQYLMRNNPRFSNFAEASPYVRGLREVSEEIKQELFTFDDNRLARIKAEARRKRNEREKIEQLQREEKERRQTQLITQFAEWNVPTDNNRVELSLLQNALRSFAEIAEQLPAELREVAKFGHPLEPTDETGRTLAVKEFAQYISLFVEDLPIEVFEQFMVHMSKCAAAHRASAERENRRIILTNLFLLCDHGGMYKRMSSIIKYTEFLLGLLDRHRILTLFEQYWDMLKESTDPKGTLRNPRRWPVVEVDEVDDSMFDAWADEPDGGLTESEMNIASTQMTKISTEVQKQAAYSAATDHLAREKWKMEQLSEKSEGMRIKIYSYGPRDFMTLLPYPWSDTLECPKGTFELLQVPNLGLVDKKNFGSDLQNNHDLWDMSKSKTKAERIFLKEKIVPRKFEALHIVIKEDAHEDVKPMAVSVPEEEKNTGLAPADLLAAASNASINQASPGLAANVSANVSSTSTTNRNSNALSARQKSKRQKDATSHNVAGDEQYKNTSANANSSGKQKKDVELLTCKTSISEKIVKDEASVNRNLSDKDHIHTERKGESYDGNSRPSHYKENYTSTMDMTLDNKDEKAEMLKADVKTTKSIQGLQADCDLIFFPNQRLVRKVTSEANNDGVTGNRNNSMGPSIERSTDEGNNLSQTTSRVKIVRRPSSSRQPQDSSYSATDLGSNLKDTISTPQGRVNITRQHRQTTCSDASTSMDQKVQQVSLKLPPLQSSLKVKQTEFGSGYYKIKTPRKLKKTSSHPHSCKFSDVDITGELAANQTKSALKRLDIPNQPTATGRASVTFAGNTAFDRERTACLLKFLSLPCEIFSSLLLGDTNANKDDKDINQSSCHRVRISSITTNSRSQSQMSAFDESVLNVSQFVQLTETFLGHHPNDAVFDKLVNFVKEGYEETEDEKMERLVKARKEAISAKRKLMMDNLFEKWDNDGSGFLEMEDVQEIMFKYKDGQEIDSIKRAQTNLKKKSKYHDQRLSKREFRQFIELVVEELPGAESFEYFVDFLTNSVERSYAERIRGEARKKWLQQIITASQVSGTSLDPVYKAVFQALYKDAETHGGEKRISASIAMLERNSLEPSRGDLLLRYSACTPEDCQYMLGKAMYKNMKGVSFQAVESGKPIHIPRVANHGSIYFWNYDRLADDREGSFIVVPLKDKKKRVFGVLGIDTLCDPHKKAIFITHEIQFFQGVAKSFSIAYHNVDMRRKLLRITESAISWIQRRCPHIAEITVYMVEPSTKTGGGDALLRKMMTTDKKGAAVQVTETIRLERKDNLFRDYLFKCMDNSETVTADAYGERHTASPLRNNEGKAIGVVDISLGTMKKLPPYENKEAQRMLRLLQQAHREITKEADGEEVERVLEAEKDDNSRMDIMFDRLMLMELRENVAGLDPSAFAELKGYYEPPKVIHDILRAALAVFNVERAGEGDFDDWNIVKNYINNDLIQKIKTYDPTVATELIKAEKVEKYLKATFTVPHGEVSKYGSIPAQQLYNWVFVCISLIEHTRKMRENAQGNVMVSAGDKEVEKSGPGSRPESAAKSTVA